MIIASGLSPATVEEMKSAGKRAALRIGPVAPLTAAIHARAVILARERKLSLYDALIVAAAQDAGCQILFSEDLQHGQKFGTLTVENTFRRDAD